MENTGKATNTYLFKESLGFLLLDALFCFGLLSAAGSGGWLGPFLAR
jgi:hypothetical protein